MNPMMSLQGTHLVAINTLRPRQNCRHFTDVIFKCIILNENILILLKISLNFVPKVRINNIPSLVQMMAWSQSSDKPLSEPMMVSLPMHIYVTRPQWVKWTPNRKWPGFLCLSATATIVNSLTAGRCSSNFKTTIFKIIIQNSNMGPPCEIYIRWTTEHH